MEPLIPRTRTGDVPAAALTETVNVRVTVPDASSETGSKRYPTPSGTPLAEKRTVPEKLPWNDRLTCAAPDFPTGTETGLWGPLIVKSPGGAVGVTVTLSMAVRTAVPFEAWTVRLYRPGTMLFPANTIKVQAAVGGIDGGSHPAVRFDGGAWREIATSGPA